MDLRSVDFNLLLPLRALLEERSVSRAAERMHLSQPTLSGALSKLRRHFGDELLERHGNAYTLTPLATQLLERVNSATASVGRVFLAESEFDPTASTREFSLYASDYAISILGAPLSRVFHDQAPAGRLRFLAMNSAVVNGAPESLRDHDGLLMPHGFLSGHPHQDLFVDRWVMHAANDNTEIGETLSLAHLDELPWVFTYNAQTEYTPAAKQMELLGVQPRIEVITPNFLAVPSMLMGTNRIALMQESLARRMVVESDVRMLECPFTAIPIVEAVWWNAVHARDPHHVWLRSALTEAVRRAGLEPAA